MAVRGSRVGGTITTQSTLKAKLRPETMRGENGSSFSTCRKCGQAVHLLLMTWHICKNAVHGSQAQVEAGKTRNSELQFPPCDARTGLPGEAPPCVELSLRQGRADPAQSVEVPLVLFGDTTATEPGEISVGLVFDEDSDIEKDGVSCREEGGNRRPGREKADLFDEADDRFFEDVTRDSTSKHELTQLLSDPGRLVSEIDVMEMETQPAGDDDHSEFLVGDEDECRDKEMVSRKEYEHLKSLFLRLQRQFFIACRVNKQIGERMNELMLENLEKESPNVDQQFVCGRLRQLAAGLLSINREFVEKLDSQKLEPRNDKRKSVQDMYDAGTRKLDDVFFARQQEAGKALEPLKLEKQQGLKETHLNEGSRDLYHGMHTLEKEATPHKNEELASGHSGGFLELGEENGAAQAGASLIPSAVQGMERSHVMGYFLEGLEEPKGHHASCLPVQFLISEPPDCYGAQLVPTDAASSAVQSISSISGDARRKVQLKVHRPLLYEVAGLITEGGQIRSVNDEVDCHARSGNLACVQDVTEEEDRLQTLHVRKLEAKQIDLVQQRSSLASDVLVPGKSSMDCLAPQTPVKLPEGHWVATSQPWQQVGNKNVLESCRPHAGSPFWDKVSNGGPSITSLLATFPPANGQAASKDSCPQIQRSLNHVPVATVTSFLMRSDGAQAADQEDTRPTTSYLADVEGNTHGASPGAEIEQQHGTPQDDVVLVRSAKRHKAVDARCNRKLILSSDSGDEARPSDECIGALKPPYLATNDQQFTPPAHLEKFQDCDVEAAGKSSWQKRHRRSVRSRRRKLFDGSNSVQDESVGVAGEGVSPEVGVVSGDADNKLLNASRCGKRQLRKIAGQGEEGLQSDGNLTTSAPLSPMKRLKRMADKVDCPTKEETAPRRSSRLKSKLGAKQTQDGGAHGSVTVDRQMKDEIPQKESEGEEDEIEECGESDDNGFIDDELEESQSPSNCGSPESDGADDESLRTTPDRWTFKGDMTAALGKDDLLCLEAVCALYRQQTEEERVQNACIKSNGRGFDKFNVSKGSRLGQFLTDTDPSLRLQKSVGDLKVRWPFTGVEDCRDLALHHADQLYRLYQENQDPFFGPR